MGNQGRGKYFCKYSNFMVNMLQAAALELCLKPILCSAFIKLLCKKWLSYLQVESHFNIIVCAQSFCHNASVAFTFPS